MKPVRVKKAAEAAFGLVSPIPAGIEAAVEEVGAVAAIATGTAAAVATGMRMIGNTNHLHNIRPLEIQ